MSGLCQTQRLEWVDSASERLLSATRYGHRSKSRRSIELQLEEGARDEPKLKRKGVHHVLRIQQLVVEIARCRISAKGT